MKPLKYLLGILIILQCVDCAPSILIFENAGQWLPPDFDPKKEVLTVVPGPASACQIDSLNALMHSRYPHKYIFTRPELDDKGKDADGVPYRFELRCFENLPFRAENDNGCCRPTAP